MIRFLALAASAAIGLSSASYAGPVSVNRVSEFLENIGAESLQKGILSGQPLITGQLDGLGFTIGLRRCDTFDAGVKRCGEVQFKSCQPLLPGFSRLEILEFTNAYNLSRSYGFSVIDSNASIGDVVCVFHEVDVSDENEFDLSEAFGWAQIMDDFRDALVEANVPVQQPERL